MFTINSKLEQKLLSYFFVNTDSSNYLQDIARVLSVDPANLDKKLKSLERQGVFCSEFRGKQKYYFLNKKFPLFTEYKSIINKTFGFEDAIKSELKNLKGVESAIIFGSYAKGNFDNLSDIDLLIIGGFDGFDLSKILTKLENNFGREINAVEMSVDEFETKKKQNNELIVNIFNDKIIQII